MKLGLQDLVDEGIKAVFIGNRRTDPNSASLEAFTPTDSDWPPVMRVSPIIEWNFHDVWRYIKALEVPYCTLYDRGYTSLGSIGNTKRNPDLQTKEGEYKPAYLLLDGKKERAGR